MNPRGCDRRPPPATPSGRRRSRRDDRGAAAVEMALVLPVLLLILFALIDVGRLLNTQITLTEAAREGARAVALGLQAQDRVEAGTVGISPSAVIEEEISCTGGDLTADATVELSHAFQPITPVGAFMQWFGGSQDGSATITARGVMPCVG